MSKEYGINCSESEGRGYKAPIQLRGSHSLQSKTQMVGRKDEDTLKKGKMAK